MVMLFVLRYHYDTLVSENQSKDLISMEEYRKSLLMNYKIPTITSNIHLFKARTLWQPFVEVDSPTNGWHKFVNGELVVHNVPGDHESMLFEPNVTVIADILLGNKDHFTPKSNRMLVMNDEI